MAAPRRHQVLNAQAISATGSSASLPNLGNSGSPNVVVLIDVASAPTGTTPSITFTLNAVLPDGSLVAIVAGTALTAAGRQRLTASGVVDPNVQLSWAVSGTTPNFPSISADIFFSTSDF